MGVSVASNLLKIGAEHTVSHSNLKLTLERSLCLQDSHHDSSCLCAQAGLVTAGHRPRFWPPGLSCELCTVLSSRFIMLTVAHQLPPVGGREPGVCVLWAWGDMVQACGSFGRRGAQ